MSDERDLWACANAMVVRHGDDAAAEAAARAEELSSAGDADGAAVWQLILHRIAQLQAPPPATTH